ncbi:hypothetical protein [Bradyrhizobium sp. CB1015]|uniref:hypothetical protein n=1 Tax=Bradyrhizobium sp. CB1015 TaxID=2976822 RepID=UPI0021AA568B|nr:hypothetical protein [Bradyrhizobium sp. CB1015]UWU91386.1 hypothetical protein N2604_33905 [Bradyrhizobium sp. CB1015]
MKFGAGSRLATFLADANRRVVARTGVAPAQEPVYQNIFDRDIQALGLTNDFYAVGAAANYSLLYVLLRAVRHFSFQQIVELGGGQSTLLLNQIVQAKLSSANVLTIESDRRWRDLLQSKVSHEVRLIELSQQQYDGFSFSGYDLSATKLPTAIDLFIIDGPAGGTKINALSRFGALQIIPSLNRDGFLIVVDDAERSGENALCEAIEKKIREMGIDFQTGIVKAAKQQRLFAAGKFLPAAFY